MAHTCLDTFWGKKQPIEALVAMLNLISRGGALNMSDATYFALCTLQREIERAIDEPPTEIPPLGPGPSPWPPEDEAMLRAAAQAFVAELIKDQFDVVPQPWHNAGHRNWLPSNNTQQTTPDAVESLRGGPNGHGSVAPDGILPRVRNSLDS